MKTQKEDRYYLRGNISYLNYNKHSNNENKRISIMFCMKIKTKGVFYYDKLKLTRL